ncbi:hypothetical protein [Dietzia sp. PP-33]|uniref:YncE family protein n=1 Tax=Dietzia sp. PP-33 TaxID=2957500 RepID=UPI0029AD01E7|nr:hypothetical protein [Dietzia sp. PP-33]MDX2355413.1 hypothetical protein [Dietzia sp. PP-33]
MPLRVHRRSALPAALLAVVVGLAGCSSATSQLEDYTGIEQGNARPAESPQVSDPEGGEVIPAPGSVTSLVATGDRVMAQVDGGSALEIARVEGTRWIPEGSVELPADAGTATAGYDGTVLVPYGDGVVMVTSAGDAREISGLGPVTAAAVTDDGHLLTGTPDGEVVVRDGEGNEQHRVTGLTSVDRITVARDGSVTAFSRPDTVIASIDPDEDGAGPLLRAGKGAGMLDGYGDRTVVASDTVGDTLLIYSTSPIRLHQQFPVADAPWAVAGDATRDVVWVTSTGTNTVQAYDLGDGTGIRRADIATVRQPDSLVVTESGTVVVGSSDGAGIHLMRPTLSGPSS